VESHGGLQSELDDTEELLRLAEGETDMGDIAELDTALADLNGKIDKLEFDALLSGPDDHRDAILTIHPGAGGTESLDWADMLFRMYNRWAERRGFTAELMDYQQGEEAGLKSATIGDQGRLRLRLSQSGIRCASAGAYITV